jgi:hypothetical protein
LPQGDWEPAANIPDDMVKQWKKKKPSWYTEQKKA